MDGQRDEQQNDRPGCRDRGRNQHLDFRELDSRPMTTITYAYGCTSLNHERLAAALKKLGEDITKPVDPILNKLTKSHTRFGSFVEMVHAEYGTPTFEKRHGILTRSAYFDELDLLSLAYDLAQEARGDNRRAFRY